MPKDDRIAYGAMCSWWDSIGAVATTPSGLPCCPVCGGVLMEVPTEREWWHGVDSYHGHDEQLPPGTTYRQLIEWCRGRCFPDQATGLAAFRSSL